jgi:hypothetical protein
LINNWICLIILVSILKSPSYGRPGRSKFGINPFPRAPRVVDPGLGGGGNPAGGNGGGGAAEFYDPDKGLFPDQSEESKTFDWYFRSNYPKKKNQSTEQCELKKEFKKDKNYGGFSYKLHKNGNPILKVNLKDGY